jgi:hypothetical protein
VALTAIDLPFIGMTEQELPRFSIASRRDAARSGGAYAQRLLYGLIGSSPLEAELGGSSLRSAACSASPLRGRNELPHREMR